jgi:hypothetical protein
VYRVDDDVFLDRVVRAAPTALDVRWHGRPYGVPLPPAARLPLFLTLEGLRDPPPGDVVLVVRRKPGLLDLFRKATPPSQASVKVRPAAP